MTTRIIKFDDGRGARVGLWQADGDILDLSALPSDPNLSGRTQTMRAFIEGGLPTLNAARQLAPRAGRDAMVGMHQARLLAPIERPARNVFCVGRNYMDHVAEGDRAQGRKTEGAPAWPQFFTKVPSAVIGPNEAIPAHARLTQALDYEAELALVIGHAGMDIAPGDAISHVYGWTIGNDVTARDVQRRHVQFFKGKSLDRSCPLGPCIVPADELDASDLAIRLWVNGELRQDSRTSRMIFDVPTIVSQLSAGMPLEVGDVVLTGTPEGVGYAMTPPRALRTDDVIRIEIEGIGVLENTVQ